jgi:hypothetical protein
MKGSPECRSEKEIYLDILKQQARENLSLIADTVGKLTKFRDLSKELFRAKQYIFKRQIISREYPKRYSVVGKLENH